VLPSRGSQREKKMKLLEISTLTLAITAFSLSSSFANPLGWVYRPYLACDKFVERGEIYGKCDIADPTGTPLNIRTLPSARAGRTVATIANDTTVIVLDRSGDDRLFIGEFEYNCKLTSELFGLEHQRLGPLHCASGTER
jgi:hypothetical protein